MSHDRVVDIVVRLVGSSQRRRTLSVWILELSSAFIAILIHVSKELIYRARCTLPVEDYPNVQPELEINNASFVSELDSSFRALLCSFSSDQFLNQTPIVSFHKSLPGYNKDR